MIGFMSIFWIAIIGFIIWAVVSASRGTSRAVLCHSDNPSDSALEILKKKYARGELSRAEFEDKKRDIS